ncbi:hypothetical protein RF11_10654 [Thelohanellus kitauei]|uniref:Sortilin C-terminal domain-containing protein n=1 Tax=Thelohanellus kitauei TaxID=669202 RepID=A0A0C2MXJ3_THEKT|nr:hypothetical protein RF11_10654 [Thelohanellus kitauei]
MYHNNGSSNRHSLISFHAGMGWKMYNSQIERFIILNNGGLLFGTKRMTNKILVSYNEGVNWYFKNISGHNLIDIFPFESENQIFIVAINYDLHTDIHSFVLFNFSHIISISHLMIDRPCGVDDFVTEYIPRYYEKCYQGKQIVYMRKKHYAKCIDNQTWPKFAINSCPCFLEDFHW